MKKIKKIRELPPKIKEIKKEEVQSDLEEDVKESEEEQFETFTRTGRMTAPVISSGQTAPQQPVHQITQRAPSKDEEEPRLYERASTSGQGKYEAIVLPEQRASASRAQGSRAVPLIGEQGRPIARREIIGAKPLEEEARKRQYEEAEKRKKKLPWE